MKRFAIRVGALAAKEATHIRRDVRVLYLALAMPVIMLVLFGFGVSFDLDHIPLAVADADRSDESRALVTRFAASKDFDLVAEVAPEDAEHALRDGTARAVLLVPHGFSRDLARGEAAEVQLFLDGSDASSTNQTLAKADAIALRAGTPAGMSPPYEVRVVTRYNPAGRSALFLVPGLTAYIMAMVAVLLTALTVAREWERGSMEQLFSTPVGRIEIILGKLAPYLALGCIQVLLVLAVGAWIFEVPIRGSLPALGVAALLFLIAMLGQGLLISIAAKNQMVATQAGTMSSLLPSMLLSGFMFPIENMPAPLRALTHVIPARYFVEVLRGVMLRGNGFRELWVQLLALAAFAFAMVVISTARFQRKIG